MTKISRRDFLKFTGIVAAGTSIAVVSGYEYGKHIGAKALVVDRVRIPLKNLPSALEGFRIVQLSDFHLHPYTQLDFLQQAVSTANKLQPDLIVLTGDYVLKGAESIFDLAPTIGSLDAKFGVFTILGNHDLWTDVTIVQTGLREARLPILRNQGVTLDVGGAMLHLAGVDDGWSGHPDLNAALQNRPTDATTILLAHEPDLADTFALDGRVALQLSGHSHGGQVRIPGIGAPILPSLGRKYDQGLYRVNDMWLYTNRGIGLIVPIRINCPPEITEITLISA